MTLSIDQKFGIRDGASRRYPVPYEGDASKGFGRFNNRIAVVTLDLSAARQRAEIKIGGTFLWAYRASVGSAEIFVNFNDDNPDAGVSFREGTALRGAAFGRIYVTHTAQAGVTLSLAYAVEQFENIEIVNPGSVVSNVGLTKGSVLANSQVATAGAAEVQLYALNASRRGVTVRNLSGTEDAYLGVTGVTTGNGMLLRPGESITLRDSAVPALFGLRSAATDVTFAILEERD